MLLVSPEVLILLYLDLFVCDLLMFVKCVILRYSVGCNSW